MSAAQKYDDGFMSLLSTQREILKRLNKEKSSGAKECELQSTGQTRESTKNLTSSVPFGEVSDPFYLMNEPIIEHRPSQKGLRHKTKSRRISESFDVVSTRSNQSSTDCSGDKWRNKRAKVSAKRGLCMDGLSIGRGNSEQHNRLRGILANPLTFDLDSTTARTQSGTDPLDTKQFEIDFLVFPKEASKRVERLDSDIDLATLKGEFENFVVAMEKSMKSQQDIHDWDRRMGLKRSHSKTMRLTMRSRNKLRKVINV